MSVTALTVLLAIVLAGVVLYLSRAARFKDRAVVKADRNAVRREREIELHRHRNVSR